jgi:hypothetical protein
VFAVSFDRGGVSLGGRVRESLAFDVVTGDTGGEPARLRWTNSDTALTVVVDPHATPDQVRQEIGDWLDRHIDKGLVLPSGRPGTGDQLLGLGKEVTGAAAQLGGAAVADVAKFLGSAVVGATTAGGTLAGGLARIVAETGMAQTKAQRGFTLELSEQLRSGSASAQQLGVFNDRIRGAAGRLRAAQEILDWLASRRP